MPFTFSVRNFNKKKEVKTPLNNIRGGKVPQTFDMEEILVLRDFKLMLFYGD